MPTPRVKPTRKPTSSECRKRVTPVVLLIALTEHFGGNHEEAIRFLRSFSPLTIHVPDREVVERLDRERRLAIGAGKDPSAENLRRLSQFYGVEVREVSKVFKKLTGQNVTDRREEIAPRASHQPVRRILLPRAVRDCDGQMMLFCNVIRAKLAG